MILRPLGVGGGFTRNYFHSNLLLDICGKRLLLDAGTTLRYSLDKAQVRPETIDIVFITHFHHDHVGGLAEFLLTCYWHFENMVHKPHRPILVLRSSQVEEINGLLAPALTNQGKVWQDYCDVRVLDDGDRFALGEGGFLEIIPTDHLHCEGLASCGVKLSEPSGKNIVVSGDIKRLFDSRLLGYIDSSTPAIIQDISFKANEVHASLEEVLDYYPEYLHEKVYGIHYEDDVELEKEYGIRLLRQGVAVEV